MEKIKIIEAGNELGLGGTEYTIQLFSKYLNKTHFEVTVVGLREGGVRVKLIEDLGIKVVVLNQDLRKLAELLQETDVFHWHGYGTLNPELFEVVRENKPKLVIQTNIFGAYKPTDLYHVIDYDLYVSKMILIRRMFYDQNMPDKFANKRKVLHNPIDVREIEDILPSIKDVQKFKNNCDIQDCFIVGRIGRADNSKFDMITLDSFAEFNSKVPQSKFLLIGSTPEMISHAKNLNILEDLIILDNTADLETLLLYYKAMDIFLAASEFGETFGMVIAESMAAGTPVVTISTPHKDNAQIELVDNGKNGLVVMRDTESIAAALYTLYENTNFRQTLAAASKEKVMTFYQADRIVKSLENLIYAHLKIPLKNPEESLLTNYSQEMVDDYISRLHDLWQPTDD